jgi:hypothetical protein
MSENIWPRACYLVCKGGLLFVGKPSRGGYKCAYCLRGIVGDVMVQRDCRVCGAKRIRG